MKTSWSRKSLVLLALLLAQPALAGTDSAVLVVRPDSTLGTIQVLSGDASRLSGWIWIEPGEMFAAGDPALVRIVAHDGATLYTDPYPIGDKVSRIAVEEDALLFADGFEAGSAWAWSAVEGQDIVTEAQSRMAATSVKWFIVDHLIGLDSGGSEVDVLLSERIGGGSASTDTPASVPFRPVLRDPDPVDWEAIRTSSGWPDIGGVLKHDEYVVTANNRRLRSTRVGPLDDLAALSFKDQSIVRYSVRKAWNSSAKRWEPQSLANSTILWRGTISDGSFSGINDNTFSYRVREQTIVGLSVPASPVEYLGLGGGVKVETGGAAGSGARIVRADVATDRGTGDQWKAWAVYRGTGDTGASEYTFWDHPTVRLARDVSGNTLKVQVKNAAGTWQTVGTSPTFTASTLFRVMLNYKLSTTTAYLWVDGVAAGSTVITGGIFASSSASTYWYNAPSTGTMEITHFFYRSGTRFLADSEISDRSLYAFDVREETDLVSAIEFGERTDVYAQDLAHSAGAVLTGFADANAAWQSSYTGESSLARSRPRVMIGQPFMAALDIVDLPFQAYSPGFPQAGSSQGFRAIVADGARLKPEISTVATDTTFTLATQQVSVVDNQFRREPAIGQTLAFAVSSGGSTTNDGDHDCAQILTDPRTLNSGTVVWVASGSVLADDNTEGDWSSYTNDFDVATSLISGLRVARVTTGAADHMAALMLSSGGGTLAEAYLENLGPVAGTITTTDVAGLSGFDFGWQGAGGGNALEQVDDLARRTPASGYGPSVVYLTTAGGWVLRGADLAPSAATYTWGEERIRSATVAALPGDFDAVRVKYAKAWNPVSPGKITSAISADPLSREAGIEWREVTAGTGSKELILEAYFLKRTDAQSFADAIYSMLSGSLYAVELNPGVKPSEAAMAPLSTVDVTWPGGALASGAKGIVAAWKVHPDKSARALVFFGSL